MKGEKGGERVPVPVAGPAFRGGVYFVLFKLFGCVLEFAFEVVSIESTFSPVCNAGLEGKNRGKPVRWGCQRPRGGTGLEDREAPFRHGTRGAGGGHPASTPSHALPPQGKGGHCSEAAPGSRSTGARIASDLLRNTRGEGSVTSVCNSNMWKLEIDCLLMPRNSNLLVRVFASSPI